MCGRYTLRTPAAQLIDVFHVPSLPTLAPRYNIAPTQLVICVRSVTDDPDSREAICMRWGLIPFWSKDMAIGNRMINARSETVAEKPAFRTAFRKRRCLIVADGFFEWQKLSTGRKQPWLMEMEDQQPFAMAGIWETWTPELTEENSGNSENSENSESVASVITCSILTTEANTDLSPLHDRMPVILPIEAWATWLSAKASVGQLNELLKPLPDGLMSRTCVSTVVNRPFPDNADCVVRVEPPEPLGIVSGATTSPPAASPKKRTRKTKS